VGSRREFKRVHRIVNRVFDQADSYVSVSASRRIVEWRDPQKR
jgi:hypothetical protein